MLQAAVATSSDSNLPTIAFNISKKELYTPTNSFKSLQRRLRGQFKIIQFKEELVIANLLGIQLLVFGEPCQKFTTDDFVNLKEFIDKGGSILYMGGEGGENSSNTNFNYLLEEYGMTINADCIVRTVYYKYFNPKEVYITDGILNREINKAAGKKIGTKVDVVNADQSAFSESSLTFLYPFGSSLNVQSPAIPLLSSGHVSYPLNRPIAGICQPKPESGKLMAIGSSQIFADGYLDKEENGKLLDVFMKLLTTKSIPLNTIDAAQPDISDYHYLPEIGKLSEGIRCCLQESEELPKDFTSLFDTKLFSFDTRLIPISVELYSKIGLKYEPLTLIQPQFEMPLPPLEPAVFQPILQELLPPALDLFDLDDHFASEKSKLLQLTSKCNNDDLEYYLRECGRIMGVTEKLDPSEQDGRHVLDYVFKKIVNWKLAE